MFQILVGSGIFTSALLLFFIQPLLAKHLLPQFGGSAFVWVASILFFQSGLLLGYLYAYLLTKLPSVRAQVFIHFVLLAASLFFIPIHLDNIVIANNQWPPASVLLLLSSIILLPFTIISASSPLLQQWYCRIERTDFPYYFYSISNAGSLLGLLGYPLFIESLIGLKAQATVWTCLYLGYCFICLLCMSILFKTKPQALIPQHGDPVSSAKIGLWLFLSFLSSALLLAVTQFLTQNIINLPLMWVIPLGLYLITFIVTFAHAKSYDRNFWLASFAIWLGLTLWLIYKDVLVGYDVVLILLALLYSACMICHGELILHKPDQSALTAFYLIIALGGVLGSLFVNIVAYVLLGKWWDFYIPLLLISCVSLILIYQQLSGSESSWKQKIFVLGGIAAFLTLVVFNILKPQNEVIAEKRSLYGYIRVFDHIERNDQLSIRELRHGNTLHGMQFLNPQRQQWPTTYYTRNAGVGLAIEYLHEHLQRPINIAVIGLGTGTIASLALPKDHIDFYEVDENVNEFAHRYFTFLKQSAATTDVIVGDARLSMVKKRFAKDFKAYDLIVADAFNGDAIPFHLLTEEAMSLYRQLLAKDGIIAFHISNIFINLVPVTSQLAQKQGFEHYWLKNNSDRKIGQAKSDWVLVSANPELASWFAAHHITPERPDSNYKIDWTDDNNSILPLLKIKLL
ncbi:fused MFS/spermidine synthase [Candidatus Berkiella aquae]|uniref:Spermidine synthase n=1 Tax=Candidatus Berkiella aquae TaxID=295108 RepID=A0A0Q9YP53_9GAMM|nr:fused MFS/spermidine synthase [Candidatus Berkiella aquae]MCS5712062.1 fused MFS/spermidine synthase [Candidatus Berkiella aquae]